MLGSDWTRQLQWEWVKQQKGGPVFDYEQAVLDAVNSGWLLPIEFVPVQLVPASSSTTGVRIFVMREPLRIGSHNDYVYPMVSARLQQILADMLELQQPTRKIMDEARKAADVRVDFQPQHWSADGRRAQGLAATPDWGGDGVSTDMSDPYAAYVQTHRIREIAGSHPGALSLPWKCWPLTNRITETVACNHGAYAVNAPSKSGGCSLYQPESYKHDPDHYDYSQLGWYVNRECRSRGEWSTIEAVGRDPATATIVDYEPLHTWRYPGVPSHRDTIPSSDMPLVYDRLLTLRDPPMYGADVDSWRGFLGLGPGSFDVETQNKTQAWQKSSGLVADGKVGRLSIEEANRQKGL